MRTGKWHRTSAFVLIATALSLVSSSALGQDCPNCVSSDAGVPVSGTAAPNYNCFNDCQSPCNGNACYGYRPYTEASQPDVFYNLYVPNNMGSAAAAYPAPYPTPSLIGHTYYTYQPLMPHEFLYHHHRTYRQYYNGGMGMNRTKVHWHGTPVRTAAKSVVKMLRLPH